MRKSYIFLCEIDERVNNRKSYVFLCEIDERVTTERVTYFYVK